MMMWISNNRMMTYVKQKIYMCIYYACKAIFNFNDLLMILFNKSKIFRHKYYFKYGILPTPSTGIS